MKQMLSVFLFLAVWPLYGRFACPDFLESVLHSTGTVLLQWLSLPNIKFRICGNSIIKDIKYSL